MQPVFPHRPQNYPPRGNQWPQWGDDVLEETLSLSEGARRSLNQKREAMSDFHKEIMEHHGLAPKPDDAAPAAPRPGQPPQPPPLPREEHAWPNEMYDNVPKQDPRHQGERIPVPRDDDENVTMIVPATQPPPPPDGPRIAQDRLRRPPAQTPSSDPSFPGFPPGPDGPPGRYPRTSLVRMDHDASMGPEKYNIGDEEDLMSTVGKPPDFPGSGASTDRGRAFAPRSQALEMRSLCPGPIM